MPRPPKPVVRNNLLLIDASQPGQSTPVSVGSEQWHVWLQNHDSFIFEGDEGHFTAQREMRKGNAYWYAYRRREGKLSKVYLGKSEELGQAQLEQASACLAGQTLVERLSTHPDEMLISSREPWANLSLFPLAKVRPPVLPQKLIERPHLTRRINTPVTLVYAPSGFGKSTLLSEWSRTCGMPVAWVTLSADDNQLMRFWTVLVTALQATLGLGHVMAPYLRISSPGEIPEMLMRLTTEIVQAANASNSNQYLGLVLDNYDHIQHPKINALVQAWLEQIPSTMRLIISSRTKPPFALGHLRARGILTELDIDDLRLSIDEGVNLLERYIQGSPLAYSDMETLVKRTEGWTTGLTLALLALNKQSNRRDFIDTFSGTHTYLSEYFTERVLDHQPPAVQSFLLKTSILKQLTGSLCDALTGQTNGADMLSRLWQENLFVVQLAEDDWYQYHELFAEMLQGQLNKQFPDEITDLHRQAAEWYRLQNAPENAVYHLLAIQAWEEAASLIESMALRELEQFGEDSRLLHWLRQLPEKVVQQHKTLLFVYVRLARVALHHTEVEQFLARIETSILNKPPAEQTPDEQDVLTEINRILYLPLKNEPGADQFLAGGENSASWQLLSGILLIQPPFSQDLVKEELLAREIYESARKEHNLFVMMMVGGNWANLVLLQGHFRRSEKIAHQVLQDALAQRGKLPETASIVLVSLSRNYYERNQLKQAYQLLLRATEVDPNPTSSNFTIQCAIMRAKIQLAEGNAEAAQATIQAARELHIRRPSGIWADQDLTAYQALFAARQGDLELAEKLLSEERDIHTSALSGLVRALILVQQKQAAAAESTLRELIANNPQILRDETIINARLLLSLALFEQHRIHEALRTIVEVVRTLAPEAYIRPFLDFGSQILPLLALALHTESLTAESQSFLRTVLRLLGPEDTSFHLSRENLLALSAAASISTREQEVLRLVSAGLPNKEIANRLAISKSTVKTHLENIYIKLGVNSRVQAIAHAQALKLV